MTKEKREKNKNYRVVGIYDTETCNIKIAEKQDTNAIIDKLHAFPILFIYNRIECKISEYEPEEKDNIFFLRYGREFLKIINEEIEIAKGEYIPIICAYNLMFDLQPIFGELCCKYNIRPIAQSSTNAYAIDLKDDEGTTLLRFWDTSHLEPRGLWAMGQAAGLDKAIGDWDYTLIRTPETPLTELELHYAARDVQVIPAFLKYMLGANAFLNENDLGNKLLTKTGLVRLLAKRVTGSIKVKGKRKDYSLEQLFRFKCNEEQPENFKSYAIRKACFRGGLTFTAANNASKIHENVVSIDAVSMHHAHINGMFMWYKFKPTTKTTLKRQLQVVGRTTMEEVLKNYSCPFHFGIHAKVHVTGIRLKNNSVFKTAGIATLAEAKFAGTKSIKTMEDEESPRKDAAALIVAKSGYRDQVDVSKPNRFAYSKLVSAEDAIIHVSEIEWWIFCQVYDFDEFEVLEGESSITRGRAPEYITLLSNMLYKQKNEMKQVLKTYEPGKNNSVESCKTLPKHIRNMISEGSASREYMESYYKNIIKGQYNAIYGMQAQDSYKPEFKVADMQICIDDDTRSTSEHFEKRKGDLVLYTYGLRIVGRSRMHLTIAIMLLDQALGNRIKILGGDTDSIKMSVAEDVTDDEIMKALEPLHIATKKSIDIAQRESRAKYPDITSDLDHLGEFEIETYNSGKDSRYKYHMEYWNKCRISIDQQDHVHITCAGVSRPEGFYTIENLAEDIMKKYGYKKMFELCCGYNVFYDPSISYLLQHNRPRYTDTINNEIIDYTGLKAKIDVAESIALAPTSKKIGDSSKLSMTENIAYQEICNGRKLDVEEKEIYITGNEGVIIYAPDTIKEKIYKIKRE